MGENWQAGDLALCVKGEGSCLCCGAPVPQSGSVWTVLGVSNRYGPLALLLVGIVNETDRHFGYDPGCFRKVTPPKADEFDREVIELLNRQPAEVNHD